MSKPTTSRMPPLLIAQVGSLYRIIHRDCTTRFREMDFPLDLDQIPVLMLVYYREHASQQEIGTTLGRDKASINRTIAYLAKHAYVTVAADQNDKRKTIIQLTPEGKKLARLADKTINQYNNALSDVLTPEEQTKFHSIIQKLVDKKR